MSADLEILAYIVVGIIVVSENLILIGIIYKNESLHTEKYFFAFSLGITDLLVGLMSVFTSILYFSGSAEVTVFSSALLLQAGFLMLSITHMAVIAVERYVYIAHPFLYELYVTPSKIARFLVIFWIAGLVYLFCVCFIQLYVVGKIVFLMTRVNTALKYSCFLTVYISMTIISFVLYVLILHQVKKHGNSVSCSEQPNALAKWKENVRCLKFFVTVFGFFFLMTSPYFIVEIAIGGFITNDYIENIMLLCLILNSGVNFIVLVVVDKHFRRILKASLSRLIRSLTTSPAAPYLCRDSCVSNS